MTRLFLLSMMASIMLTASSASPSMCANELKFKREFLLRLVKQVPDILKSQDPKTGRFGSGIWICGDQVSIYPLAAVWATKSDNNPYYHDAKLLDAIVAGGDVLIENQDKAGMWRFDKKDGSFWGMIHMPWTYSRWIRVFALIRNSMPADKRKRWEKALILGYGEISKRYPGGIHNIQTHHAMGLFLAGQLFDKPEWRQIAKDFMPRVVAAQDPGGFWTEHFGPVVQYNYVYSDSLGVYYAISNDQAVLPALERAARFHAAFTYPDGVEVETIDERNPYELGQARIGNVGLSFTPEGRGFISHQIELLNKAGGVISNDDMANFLLYAQEGPAVPTSAEEKSSKYTLGDNDAIVRREGQWFICVSAYVCPPTTSRWIQDRQNLVSVYHDKTGLILGGGDTKLQPLWSNFTVGDVSLLKHKSGDENPNFTPDIPLKWVPDAARIKKSDPPGIALAYGEERCSIDVAPIDDKKLNIRLRATVRSGQPVAAHITLIAQLDKPIRFASGVEKDPAKDSFTLTASETGKWIEHAGWRLLLPDGTTVTWPALPHNPYAKDGSATIGRGRIVVTLPFSKDMTEYSLELTIND